jgi:hypothetical protein
MRASQWAVGMVVVGVLAGTTACGGSEVIVRPVGDPSAVGTCVPQSTGAPGCAESGNGADQPPGVSIGPDGATVTDGQGAGVSIGADGASVGAGSSAGEPEPTGGSTGTVELTGAVSLRDEVSGGCNWFGPESRGIYAELADQTLLEILIYNSRAASVSLVQGERSWRVGYPGNAGDVMTMDGGSIQLRGARLVGEDGTVDLTATFDC